MRLAFYYHIPLHFKVGKLYAPAFLGVFIDELAKNVEELFVVMHDAVGNEIKAADYQLSAANIRMVSLGKKTHAFHRAIFSRAVLKNKLKEIENCDAFLIRSPSPLAAHFRKHLKRPKIFFMIVGDYKAGAIQNGKKGLKNFILYQYNHWVDKGFLKQFPTTDVFVNSPQLFEQYQEKAKSITLIKTSTLRREDFFEKTNEAILQPIKLLYTGRIELAKGLKELVEATEKLNQGGIQTELSIVGWEEKEDKPVEHFLIALARQLGIEQLVKFPGKKKVGVELNTEYRKADIYVLPSYHEGFPRTIWEAMANSLPVIATKVGGIPFYLENHENALLIDPKNSTEIAASVKALIESPTLVLRLIDKGLKLAKENSLEIQTQLIVKTIAEKL